MFLSLIFVLVLKLFILSSRPELQSCYQQFFCYFVSIALTKTVVFDPFSENSKIAYPVGYK